jgi:aminomethyltransferase
MSEDRWMLVVNAGNIDGDFEHLKKNNTFGLKLENKSDYYAKFDLQGKYAPKLLAKLAGKDSVDKLAFYRFREGFKIKNTDIIISRTGYTGEVGFEIYFDASKSLEMWNLFLKEGKEFGILPCGLAARDSLRLEAGLPLHGHEIHPDMIALGHPWMFCISDREEYIGRKALKNGKPEYYIKPFIVNDKRKAMPHYGVFNENDKQIGEVASGVMSPTLNNKPIGYCKIKEDLPENTKIFFKDETGKKKIEGYIAKNPFIDTLTWRKKMSEFID